MAVIFRAQTEMGHLLDHTYVMGGRGLMGIGLVIGGIANAFFNDSWITKGLVTAGSCLICSDIVHHVVRYRTERDIFSNKPLGVFEFLWLLLETRPFSEIEDLPLSTQLLIDRASRLWTQLKEQSQTKQAWSIEELMKEMTDSNPLVAKIYHFFLPYALGSYLEAENLATLSEIQSIKRGLVPTTLLDRFFSSLTQVG